MRYLLGFLLLYLFTTILQSPVKTCNGSGPSKRKLPVNSNVEKNNNVKRRKNFRHLNGVVLPSVFVEMPFSVTFMTPKNISDIKKYKYTKKLSVSIGGKNEYFTLDTNHIVLMCHFPFVCKALAYLIAKKGLSDYQLMGNFFDLALSSILALDTSALPISNSFIYVANKTKSSEYSNIAIFFLSVVSYCSTVKDNLNFSRLQIVLSNSLQKFAQIFQIKEICPTIIGLIHTKLGINLAETKIPDIVGCNLYDIDVINLVYVQRMKHKDIPFLNFFNILWEQILRIDSRIIFNNIDLISRGKSRHNETKRVKQLKKSTVHKTGTDYTHKVKSFLIQHQLSLSTDEIIYRFFLKTNPETRYGEEIFWIIFDLMKDAKRNPMILFGAFINVRSMKRYNDIFTLLTKIADSFTYKPHQCPKKNHSSLIKSIDFINCVKFVQYLVLGQIYQFIGDILFTILSTSKDSVDEGAWNKSENILNNSDIFKLIDVLTGKIKEMENTAASEPASSLLIENVPFRIEDYFHKYPDNSKLTSMISILFSSDKGLSYSEKLEKIKLDFNINDFCRCTLISSNYLLAQEFQRHCLSYFTQKDYKETFVEFLRSTFFKKDINILKAYFNTDFLECTINLDEADMPFFVDSISYALMMSCYPWIANP